VTPIALQLYRIGTALLSPLAPALLNARARRGKEDPARLSERLGYAGMERPDGPLIWLHGASVGETLSLLPLIDGLRARRPALTILVTSGTVTSAALLAQRAPGGVIHQYAPIDTPTAAARFLAYWKPTLSVFVESEIWPNLILGAKAGGSRLALLSARLSDASLKGWSRLPGAAKAIFDAVDLVMAQEDATATALVRLGARDDGRLNLKRLGAPPPVDANKLVELRQAAEGKPVLLAASTHPGEDEMVLDAFLKVEDYARLVIVPRHPSRASEIAVQARNRSYDTGFRTEEPFGEAHVYIADTLGELGLWFSLADAAFIGGSLLPGPGGHNPVEAAQLGCPIVTGPHLDNWREVYADLFRADAAVRVDGSAALTTAFTDALNHPDEAQARADRARHVVAQDQASLDRALEALLSLIP
jgi:3-deoxy-D-manno-octulosonic-acid transferase